MPKAIVLEEFGGPEQMQWRDIELPAPGAGEALIRQTACGLNFIDTYQRTGLYPLELPSGLGMEAAGEVLEVGDGVDYVAPGDRVAYTSMPPGAYAEQRVYEADKLVKLPEGVDDQTAAACMLKGLTAWYLLKRSYRVQSGDTVLVYAAAGGVGAFCIGSEMRALTQIRGAAHSFPAVAELKPERPAVQGRGPFQHGVEIIVRCGFTAHKGIPQCLCGAQVEPGG